MLSQHLTSKVDSIGEEAVHVAVAIAANCSDAGALDEVIKFLFGLLNGKVTLDSYFIKKCLSGQLAQLLRHCPRSERSVARIPGRSNLTQCRQRFASAVTFLWSSVAQALSRGDGPRYSLHALA